MMTSFWSQKEPFFRQAEGRGVLCHRPRMKQCRIPGIVQRLKRKGENHGNTTKKLVETIQVTKENIKRHKTTSKPNLKGYIDFAVLC